MTYHRIDEEDRNDLHHYLSAHGFGNGPGPRNWLRSMVFDWAEAEGLDHEDEDGVPFEYDHFEQMAYQAMVEDDEDLWDLTRRS